MRYEVSKQLNVTAQMRDGTILRADVYQPVGAHDVPVLLSRTPYDKAQAHIQDLAPQIARRGYIVVVQDCRGRHASDGDWKWSFGFPAQEIEADDGYDSVQWAAGLEGTDGQVGLWGHSYPSFLAWRAAGACPPNLKAIFATGMLSRYRDMSFGMFETNRRLLWAYRMAVDARRRKGGSPDGPTTLAEADHVWTWVERQKWLWYTPLEDIPSDVFGEITPQLKRLYRETPCQFWNFDEIHHKVQASVCCTTGWWDRTVGGIDSYTGMVTSGPEATRGKHRLVVGPWGHNTLRYDGRIGPRDYGPDADVPYVDQLCDYFDFALKGLGNEVAQRKRVKLFILNENKWRYFDSWPPPETIPWALHLSSGGGANTPAGNGVLADKPSGQPDHYAYDPKDPVMSMMEADAQAAPCDQAPLDCRQDVLVYQTSPLENDVTLVGPVECILWVATDAPDTDFAVKLVEVAPNGSAINLSYGIVRLRYREGFDKEVLARPEETYELRLRMNPVGIKFTKGCRIRLDIASSDFPNFDRNHNTGRDFWTDREFRVANQTVFHDERRPSRIILPLLA